MMNYAAAVISGLALAFVPTCEYPHDPAPDAAPSVDASQPDATLPGADVGDTADGGRAPSADGTCTLEEFGAVGDGITSDQPAYGAAAAACAAGTCRALRLGAKTYFVAPVNDSPWPMGCSIIGQGSASVLKTISNTSVVLLRDTNMANRQKSTSFAHFTIEGNSTGATQNGIKVGYQSDGASRVRVTDVTAHHLGGIGFAMAYSDDAAIGPQLDGCRAYNCTTGFALQQSVATNISADYCSIGVDVIGGNVNVIGGLIRGCTTGAYVRGGGNDSHGSFSSVQFLHNTTALRIGAILNGHLFSGCMFYQGILTFDGGNAGAAIFSGGLMDLTTYTLIGRSRFLGVTMNTNFFLSATAGATGQNEFVNVLKVDGTVPGWITSL